MILDLFGGSAAADAVDPLVGLGALAAVPAVVSGLSDWADSYGPERRVGLVHAAANVTGLGLFAASMVAGHRSARRLRLLGLAAVSAGGYLGGHLSFGRGVGVDHQAFLEKPGEWTDALAADSLEEATPTFAEAGGARVDVYKRQSRPSTRALPHTSQAIGARTVTVRGPFRSGWSKQAKTRCV